MTMGVKRRSLIGLSVGALLRAWCPQQTREAVLPHADRVTHGDRVMSTLYGEERVGTATDVDDLQKQLAEIGYSVNTLAALKRNPETGETDDASLRLVDDENPRWQWHVHLFKTGEKTDIYIHYEVRPDPVPIAGESWEDVTDRLDVHYAPVAVYHRPSADIREDIDHPAFLTGFTHRELDAVLSG